jgi:hypothetical protein
MSVYTSVQVVRSSAVEILRPPKCSGPQDDTLFAERDVEKAGAIGNFCAPEDPSATLRRKSC